MDQKIYLKMHAVEDEHWWFVGRRRIVESVIQSLPLPETADILDAGCGTGGNLTLLNHYGRVQGMELDKDARELANRRRVGNVLPGRLPNALPFTEQRFDLVLLLDVLEHIRDDAASLAALAALLKPGGRIVLTVPAFPSLWGPHDEAHHHQRRYRTKSLQRVITTAGLETEHMSYFNTWLFPLIAPLRLLQRLLPPAETELSLPASTINRLLTTLFASERAVVARRHLPFGLSLLAVLKFPKNI